MMNRVWRPNSLIGAAAILQIALASCASVQEGESPQSVVNASIGSSNDVSAERYLKTAAEQPIVETIEVGQEFASRSKNTWTFSPSFILETIPDAALTTLEEAILQNDADAFCSGVFKIERCKKIFAENGRHFSDAYNADTGERYWLQTPNGLTTTLARLTFFFERQETTWKLTGFCAVNTSEMIGMPECKK